MFHFQGTPNDWPRAVAKLPDQCCIKAVDRADILRDAKAARPGIFTILRHWDDSLQHYDGNKDLNVWKDRARHWFSTHIDGTFREQYARFTDAVSWHNEIWANSQNDDERQERIIASQAAVAVWNNEYRNQSDYSHIRLVIGEAAVGNDMPKAIASLAIAEDAIVGYHPYSLWQNKARLATDFRFLSGRYNEMEQAWGLKPIWAFTEAGPFEGVIDGWRSDKCLGADDKLYVEAVRLWIKDMQTTDAYKKDRILGFTLFTSGGGEQWKKYETQQPEMDMLADMIAVEWKPGTVTPPPPPEKDPCKPREGFNRKTTNVIPQDMALDDAIQIFSQVWQESKETVAGSYDEAGLGPKELTRVAKLWNIPQVDRQKYIDWYALHYPGVQVIFKDIIVNGDHQIIDVVDQLPKHATRRYKSRPLTDITTLVIHHTVSGCTRSTASIASYHVNDVDRQYPGIAYHYVIGCDGKIELVNYHETISYHAYGNNEYTIGIALKDDFTDHPPTQQALDSARWLVQHLKTEFGGLDVKRHRDLVQTACPGATSPDWIGYIRGD